MNGNIPVISTVIYVFELHDRLSIITHTRTLFN